MANRDKRLEFSGEQRRTTMPRCRRKQVQLMADFLQARRRSSLTEPSSLREIGENFEGSIVMMMTVIEK